VYYGLKVKKVHQPLLGPSVLTIERKQKEITVTFITMIINSIICLDGNNNSA
jgi:hypothetical protein